jgi:hypothetical protein
LIHQAEIERIGRILFHAGYATGGCDAV